MWVTGLRQPVDMAQDPTNDARFLVVEKAGTVRAIEDGALVDGAVFEVNRDNFTDRNWEQGLLGIAFDPAYADNRRVYFNYTGNRGTTHISRYTASDDGTIDATTEEILLTYEQPYPNHNGGAIRFGPDGMLWIGTGDGGAANDPHGYGQKTDTLLGKMLRIDVTGEPDDGLKYAIPENNPFVGNDDFRPEIWAIGLRNPWRYEWDAEGNLWIADVGQNRFEEIHVEPQGSAGGLNYG